MEDRKPCLLYSASYHHASPEKMYAQSSDAPPTRYMIAGGDISNEAKLFRTDSRKCIGIVCGMQHAVYSVALGHKLEHAALGGGSRILLVMKVDTDFGQDLVY